MRLVSAVLLVFAGREALYYSMRIDQGSTRAARANVDGKVIRLHYSNPQGVA